MAGEVGTLGSLGGQALVPGVAGVWKDLTDNVNVMAANVSLLVLFWACADWFVVDVASASYCASYGEFIGDIINRRLIWDRRLCRLEI